MLFKEAEGSVSEKALHDIMAGVFERGQRGFLRETMQMTHGISRIHEGSSQHRRNMNIQRNMVDFVFRERLAFFYKAMLICHMLEDINCQKNVYLSFGISILNFLAVAPRPDLLQKVHP